MSAGYLFRLALFVYERELTGKTPPILSGKRTFSFPDGAADLVVRARTAVSAKAFFRFVGWFSHQASNAHRSAAISITV